MNNDMTLANEEKKPCPPPPNACPQPSPAASKDSKRQTKGPLPNRTPFPPPWRFSVLLPLALPSHSSSFSLMRWLPPHTGSYPTRPSHPCISEHRLPRKGCSLLLCLPISLQPMSLKSGLRKLWAPLFWSLQIPNSGFGSCILLRAIQHFKCGQFMEEF